MYANSNWFISILPTTSDDSFLSSHIWRLPYSRVHRWCHRRSLCDQMRSLIRNALEIFALDRLSCINDCCTYDHVRGMAEPGDDTRTGRIIIARVFRVISRRRRRNDVSAPTSSQYVARRHSTTCSVVTFSRPLQRSRRGCVVMCIAVAGFSTLVRLAWMSTTCKRAIKKK